MSVTMKSPDIPIINNVDVTVLTEVVDIRDALVRQAAAPVRWVEIMLKMQSFGVTHILECGPGKVLAGLSRRCADSLTGVAMNDLDSLKAAVVLTRAG